MSAAEKTATAGARGRAAEELIEIGKTVVYALVIALVLRVFLFQPFTIPSASMEPTLMEGDYIIVSKYSYGYSRHSAPFSPPVFSGRLFERAPRRGDVVVFKLPRDDRTDYIKRLVGLPGDRVQMRGGLLYVNDQPVERRTQAPVTIETDFGPRQVDAFLETLPEGRSYATYDQGPGGEVDDTAVFRVPAGHYFFMGDNRDNSLDSRYGEDYGVGFVPAENLVGRAEIVLLSWERGASLLKPWTWATKARPGRILRVLK